MHEEPVDPTLDYGQTTKTMVLEMWSGEGAPAKGSIDILLENLEGYEQWPVGPHKATYDELYRTAQEVQQMYGRNAGRAEINAKLTKLKELALRLPGDLPGQGA